MPAEQTTSQIEVVEQPDKPTFKNLVSKIIVLKKCIENLKNIELIL